MPNKPERISLFSVYVDYGVCVYPNLEMHIGFINLTYFFIYHHQSYVGFKVYIYILFLIIIDAHTHTYSTFIIRNSWANVMHYICNLIINTESE